MLNQPPPQAGNHSELSDTSVALRAISEARRILEEVITSSESFDYPKAKDGLKQLQGMIRNLGREEARLRARRRPGPSVECAKVLPFPGDRESQTES